MSGPPVGWLPRPKAKPFSDEISTAASMTGIPTDLATRLVKQESSFNPHAKSPVGALGLTQLMPDTAKMLGVSDPFNPAENLAGGFKYIAGLYKQFGTWGHALAAYNWGPGNVQAWLARGGNMADLPAETRQYVATIAPHEFVSVAKAAAKRHLQLLGDRVAPPPPDWKPRAATPPPDWKPRTQQTPTPYLLQDPNTRGTITDPMDTESGSPEGDTGTGNAIGPTNFSFVSQLAGHQDLPFILENATDRDAAMGNSRGAIFLLRDPNSETSKAFHLYLKNPAQAMDEYGQGSPIQNEWMAKHAKGFDKTYSQFFADHPILNAANTFITEQANPMALAEGGIAGKALGAIGKVSSVQRAAQGAARAAGVGSPLYGLANRGGTEAAQWAKSLIASVKAPEYETRVINQQVFGNLTNAEQREVVRLSQGLKPDPQFFKQYADLKKRSDILRTDIKHVTSEQIRTQVLDPKQGHVHNPERYFPMSNSYDFGPQHELEAQLRGGLNRGGGTTANTDKTYKTLDEALRGGHVADDFSPPTNYTTWRRQRLQRVAFEDSMERAPQSLRRDVQSTDYANGMGQTLGQPWIRRANQTPSEALDQSVAENNARFAPGHPERLSLADNEKYVSAYRVLQNTPSAVLKRSMIAPELMDFFKDGRFEKYITRTGSQLPGEQNTWAGRFVSLMRNMIVSNFVYHPMVNVAGNDAAARGMHGLGGPVFEAGGYAYNSAKALALQAGMDPKRFLGGVKKYASWYERALHAGAIAEFGVSPKSALGGDTAKVLTEKGGHWVQRLDKALTKAGNFNMDRTFREKGEEAFAVSLFKDAVWRGHNTDADAGKIVREALGDYYNFDPQSSWSSAFMFMPWLKSNTKFWLNVLARKPGYALGTAHAARNYNISQNAPELQSPFPSNDFMVHPQGMPMPWYFPFVGRDLQHIVNGVGGIPQGPGVPLTEAQKLVMARANPLTKAAQSAEDTANAVYSRDVQGPETNFNLMFNPKAPPNEQYKQLGSYFVGHGLPVPLVGYAVQDAFRRGMNPRDVATALASATGLGYPGVAKLDDGGQRELRAAQAQYKKAYDTYQYDDRDPAALQAAWDQYTQTLRDLGVIH